MKNWPISNCRLRMAFLHPVETLDASGGASRTFAPHVTLWGSLHPVSIKETWQADRFEQTRLFDITVRYRTDLAAGMRVLANDRIFQVQTLHDPDSRRRFLTLRVEEATL